MKEQKASDAYTGFYTGLIVQTFGQCAQTSACVRLQSVKENGELFTEEVIKNIIEEFSLSDEEAEKYMKMYW